MLWQGGAHAPPSPLERYRTMPPKPLYAEYGTDVAGADAYASVIASTTRECQNIMLEVATKDAIVSLDGGTTGHIYVVAGAAPIVLNGVSIPKGADIQGKNAAAGQNYANLRIHIW